eukprot:TRINITY_DN68622_c0_g1_i1.p1 TRINITY_DN68622_c0_g1~~TRINITY_DN68622_c0_g1_i1.p1  ORF type:complete len:559 (-),score=37.41 TRINITY_DN68622_c0_g1_i1:59-1687(-)
MPPISGTSDSVCKETELMACTSAERFESTSDDSDAIARRQTVLEFECGKPQGPRRTYRKCVLDFVVSGPWITVQFLAVIIDVDVAIMIDPDCWYCTLVTFLTSSIYIFDLVLRIIGYGPYLFFRNCWNLVDTAVIIISSIVVYFDIPTKRNPSLSFLRLIRVLRGLFMLIKSSRKGAKCMRRVTGQNKRRFVSKHDDFDLDLSYISERLIAMSIPASSFPTRIYRNPIVEVVRFFQTYHADSYMIVNVCPEIPYPSSSFQGGVFQYFDVQDHTPPLISDTVQFLSAAREFMLEDDTNVLAIHCRGGKGRTGTFCCAWLLYTREARSVQDALNLFALRRTDLAQTGKLQGVETPSQVRYVEYMWKHLQMTQSFFPSPLKPPVGVRIRLQKIRFRNVFREEDRLRPCMEICVAVHDGQTMRVVHWSGAAAASPDVELNLEGTTVQGDARISIFCRGKLSENDNFVAVRKHQRDESFKTRKRCVAGQEQGILFYFLFHTTFLEDNELVVPMHEVDNARKRGFVVGDIILNYVTRPSMIRAARLSG